MNEYLKEVQDAKIQTHHAVKSFPVLFHFVNVG